MPVSTIRVWVIGSRFGSPNERADFNVSVGPVMTILLAGLNQFFFFRYPSVTVGAYVAVLISLPLGRAWAAVRFLICWPYAEFTRLENR